jgi:7,8-dihydropterin-6-yl-methyl-4-(beta-D-ribofuranosyl)aminobenzene 5'-phosphate synthase
VTLTVVYDNQAYGPELKGDWGFACLIERGTDTVLFDTGASGALLLENLTALGHTPQEINAVILSHAHTDHTGGLMALLDTGATPTIYLPATFPEAFKRQIEARVPLVQVSEPGELRPGFFSTGPLGTAIPEQALAVQTPAGLVVVAGCAHPGVDLLTRQALATASEDEAALLLGGFHLGSASIQEIARIINDLRALGVQQVAPCHCTGTQAQQQFAETYGADYLSIGAGWVLPLTPEPAPEAGP